MHIHVHIHVHTHKAESFIETIGEDNFGRSLAGDVVSPVRTSHQSWCQSEPCLSDERTRAVHERVVGVTGVPIENAEYFQVGMHVYMHVCVHVCMHAYACVYL